MMESQYTSGTYDPHNPQTPSLADSQPSPNSQSQTRPSRPVPRQRKSMMDELLPLPTPSNADKKSAIIPLSVLRRTGSVAIITIFLLSVAFMASTAPEHRRTGLRTIFGVGNDVGIGGAGWVAQDLGDALNHKERPKDFDQYVKMQTIPSAEASIEHGDRLIFIGDIHGSFAPLQRLLTTIQYDMDKDKIIHVGDLIAKGERNLEVLDWMREFKVHGVRGNHDQPVIQWRSWMEWAGGDDWKKFIDDMADEDEEGLVKTLRRQGKQWPKSWKWKSQHWHIARALSPKQFQYLLDLPLALHFPSLHSFVVHAGLMPSDPTKHLSDTSQPLVAAAESHFSDSNARRMAEELSILFDVKQNTDPYTLIEMRSVHMHGKKKGKVTKDGSKGTPWSNVWNKEIKRCTRSLVDDDDEREDKRKKDEKEEEDESSLECSPVSIIYGHAAGRGLDIKKYTKGLDTGCVYGRQLTALVLGDKTGLQGQKIHVEGHKGVLVSIECEVGGK